MAVIQIGKKYVKTKGRRSGETCEVTKVIDKNFVEVKYEKGGKTKKCNITHLEPL